MTRRSTAAATGAFYTRWRQKTPLSRAVCRRTSQADGGERTEASRPPHSTVLERRLAFFDERRHAFLLILAGEGCMEHPALETDALGQADFKRPVDAFLHHHGR